MPRDFSIKHQTTHSKSGSMTLKDEEIFWYLIYQNQHAWLHHVHTHADDHLLCGPMVFSCQRAIDLFFENYPDFDCFEKISPSEDEADFEIKATPAHQIVSWMDAGIQVVNFIICDPEEEKGLSAAILSGNQARQALEGEISLKPFLSTSALNSIGLRSFLS